MGNHSRPSLTKHGLHDQVVHLLARRILREELAPGDILPNESDLCAELGVSRTVLREAIKVLASKGFVQTRTKVGTRVQPRSSWRTLDPDMLAWQYEDAEHDDHLLRNLLDVRRAIEPACAELAALRANEKEIAAIAAAYRRMEQTLAHTREFIQADMEFHAAIIAACQNELLDQLSLTIEAALGATRRITTQFPGSSLTSLPLHRAVLDAIQGRDPAAAHRRMRDLIDSAAGDIARVADAAAHKTA